MKKEMLFYPLFLIVFFVACEKKYDSPPLKKINESARLKIADLKARCPMSNSVFKFGMGDTNLYCTVTMDEVSGNIYKQVFVNDDAGNALMIKLVNSGGLNMGDNIRINLNGALCVSANNMIYLD